MRFMRTIVESGVNNIAIMDVMSKLIQNRTIFIDGIIDDYQADEIVSQLLYLDSESDKEITIYINSPGGSISAGLAIYDISTIIKCPIKTVGIGMCASMGAVLMLMGDVRKSLKHTWYMLHEASGESYGKTTDLKIQLCLQEKMQEDLYEIILEKTKFTREHVDSLFKDKWFQSQEALDYGLITEII